VASRRLAEGDDRALIVVHVKELFVGRAGGYPVLADEDDLQAKIRKQVGEARDEGLDATLKLVTATTTGAAHLIADTARDVDAEVIIVGTRGHSPVAGLLLGSVTQRLLHIAPCTVLAVPICDRSASSEAERTVAAATH
jgi:nucleotide-binding universal stress UspA family protein